MTRNQLKNNSNLKCYDLYYLVIFQLMLSLRRGFIFNHGKITIYFIKAEETQKFRLFKGTVLSLKQNKISYNI